MERAVLVVRNTFTHDARVLRAAKTLGDMGYEATVLAVAGDGVASGRTEVDGVKVLRLKPTSPFALARGWWRRRRPSEDGATNAGDDAPRSHPAILVRLHRWLVTLDFNRRAFVTTRRLRPAIVHCNDLNTMWIGAAARASNGAFLVYDSHELWPDRSGRREPRWWLLLSEALLVRVANRVVVTSPGHGAVMARRYRIRSPQLVRNIPDMGPLEPLPPRAVAPEATAVYVGGLQPRRGIEQAIAALPWSPKLRLRLLGPGRDDYLRELLGLARRLGVEDRVDFAGPVPNDQVVSAARDADVGLALFQPTCLSHRLVLPNKLFEYMAAGLPTLVSDFPVLRATVEQWGFGAVVDSTLPRAVADAIDLLLRPEVNERCRAAAHAASQQLNWPSERRRLLDVYPACKDASR